MLDAPEQHAEHYLAFAERVRTESFGPGRTAAFDGAEREYGHLRTALAYLIE